MQKVLVVVCDANCGREGKSANARQRCLAAAAADGGRRPFIKLCFSTITAALRALKHVQSVVVQESARCWKAVACRMSGRGAIYKIFKGLPGT